MNLTEHRSGFWSKADFRQWAEYIDKDYDHEVDVEPHVHIAWLALKKQPDTSTAVLLNVWGRSEPGKWGEERYLRFRETLRTVTFENERQFETWLEDIVP